MWSACAREYVTAQDRLRRLDTHLPNNIVELAGTSAGYYTEVSWMHELAT